VDHQCGIEDLVGLGIIALRQDKNARPVVEVQDAAIFLEVPLLLLLLLVMLLLLLLQLQLQLRQIEGTAGIVRHVCVWIVLGKSDRHCDAIAIAIAIAIAVDVIDMYMI